MCYKQVHQYYSAFLRYPLVMNWASLLFLLVFTFSDFALEKVVQEKIIKTNKSSSGSFKSICFHEERFYEVLQ